MPHIFFIEGNIGTGKSTFLSMIERCFPGKYQVIYEPLDIWLEFKDKDNKNILEYFYSDPKRYAYTFQNIAFISRLEKLEEIDMTKEFIFIERSIWADKNVFAKNCYETGLMSDIEYKLYKKWFDCLVKKLNISNYNFVYLKCSAQTSYERLNSRGRKEENGVSLEYLTQIENQHEEWLEDGDRVITIDANLNYKDEDVFRGVFNSYFQEIDFV